MKTSTHRTYEHAVVIQNDDLSELSNFLSSRYCETRFEAQCNEGSTLTFDSINELLTFENHQFRRIDAITINFIDDRGRGILAIGSVAIDGDTGRFFVADEDIDRAFLVAEEVGKRLRSCKPSYSVLSRVSGSTIVSIALLSFSVLFTWVQLLKTGEIWDTSVPLLPLFYLSLPMVPLLIVVVKYANRVWRWLFPKAWFCLGRQEAEYHKRSKVRTLVFRSIGLALMVGVAGGVITSAITS